ncbi:MAG: pentapeptide repeat-containing protein [Anaerolineae bacterium]|nr:pentapeptide repeat-containing protein [Anaerolineae bacterium]
MKLGWKNYLFYSSVVLVVGGLIYILVETINRKNTGFETKTLWDWMDLLIVPLVLAGGAFFLNRSERKTEREIATDRQQDVALQTYFDRMSELLLKEKLRTTKKAEVRDVARTRTLSIMRVLDTKRNNIIIQFLREAELVTNNKSILIKANMRGMNLQGLNLGYLNLDGADLENADLQRAYLGHASLQRANLYYANLQNASLLGANLRGAELFDANLQNAFLKNANLQDANLGCANMRCAYLNGANMRCTDLRGVNLKSAELQDADLAGANLFVDDFDMDLFNVTNITKKQLAKVKSLKGATMLDGAIHE